MHIVVANNIYPPIMAGGAELIVAFLCEALVERGHRVTVISTCGPEMEPYPIEHRNGVEIIRFFPNNLYWSFTRAARPPRGRLRNATDTARWHLRDAWNRDAGRRTAKILAAHKPDILHTHLIDGFSAALWHRAKSAGLPVIHTAHDYHLLCPRAFLLSRSWKICTKPVASCRAFRSWHLRTTRYVDLFASPSRFLLDLHEKAGLRSGATAVVHNGIPLEVAVKPEAGPARNRFLLLSRLTTEKGIDVVLEAMRRLPADMPVELTIGGRGPLEGVVREACASDPRIRFLGYVEGNAKQAELAQASYLLLPSMWYENAPVVILEAAANGLWLIASRIGGIPEFVREGETGSLFPPGDAGALAAAMMAAMNDDSLAARLRAHAGPLVQNFSVARMAGTYLEHYERLLRDAA